MSEELKNSREEEIKSWEENQEPRPGLSRRRLSEAGAKKNVLAIVGISLVAVVLIMLIVGSGNKEDKDILIKTDEEFNHGPNRKVVVPQPPPEPLKIPSGPSEEELEAQKRRLALKNARIKSQVVIFEEKGSIPADKSSDAGFTGDPNARFKSDLDSASTVTVEAQQIAQLDKRILQGKLIDATLETAINSDLPGMVRAIISKDVYSEAGTQVLLPKGSRLVGQYNSAIRKGQARVFVIWSRAITPGGVDIALNSYGSDSLGRSGLKGRVNNHFWKIFGTSALLSVIGGATANVGVSTTDQYNSISTYREGLAQGFQDTASSVLDRYLDIPPTVSIQQGSKIKVFVSKDLDFSGVFQSQFLTL